jgi:hypothetical protein
MEKERGALPREKWVVHSESLFFGSLTKGSTFPKLQTPVQSTEEETESGDRGKLPQFPGVWA